MRAAIVILVMLLVAGASSAQEKVGFTLDDLTNGEWADVGSHIFSEDPAVAEIIADDHRISIVEAMEKLRREMIWSGRFDLNLDGVSEIFVFIGHSYACGTIGCDTLVFEKVGRKWVHLSNDTALFDIKNGPELFIANEKRWRYYRRGTPDDIRLKKLDKTAKKVVFKLADFTEKEWIDVKNYFHADIPDLPTRLVRDYGLPVDQAMEKFRQERLHVGRFDLNLDGMPELYVVVEYIGYCGTFGCLTPVFELKDENWVHLYDGTALIDIRDGPQVMIVDEERWLPYRPGSPDFIRLIKLDKLAEKALQE